MSAVQIVSGFSLTNRWLLYTSLMLAPAQYISGIGSNCPSNLGFLAYNWYTQIQWYQAVKAKELHALSLLPVHFNFIYVLTYLGGVSSGNVWMGALLALGTAGVVILNTVSAWLSWSTNMTEGFGVYQFFFFGWRTLTPGWHKFILVWQIGDSLMAFNSVIIAFYLAVYGAKMSEDKDTEKMWWWKYPAIPLGAVLMLVVSWPLLLWTELIVHRNHIESETDMIAVYLFIAQAVAMIIPSCSSCLRRS